MLGRKDFVIYSALKHACYEYGKTHEPPDKDTIDGLIHETINVETKLTVQIEDCRTRLKPYSVSNIPGIGQLIREKIKETTLYAQSKDDIRDPRVVVSLHGIRTIGAWQKILADVIDPEWRCPLRDWNFGVFSFFRFLLPWQRKTKLRWFRSTYNNLLRDRDLQVSTENPPSIVAHSFGTYILGYALLRFPYIRFDKIILCGSILPSTYP
jgi:hypothetical protein